MKFFLLTIILSFPSIIIMAHCENEPLRPYCVLPLSLDNVLLHESSGIAYCAALLDGVKISGTQKLKIDKINEEQIKRIKKSRVRMLKSAEKIIKKYEKDKKRYIVEMKKILSPEQFSLFLENYEGNESQLMQSEKIKSSCPCNENCKCSNVNPSSLDSIDGSLILPVKKGPNPILMTE